MSAGFPSPFANVGGYSDDNRPDNLSVNLTVSGILTPCRWSKALRLWFPEAARITFHAATPMNSPPTLFSVPTQGNLHPNSLSQGSGSEGVSFPPLMNVLEPPFSLNARMLLDIPPPMIPLNETGSLRASSAANMYYSNIGSILNLPLPNDLCGYGKLPTEF